MSMPTVRWAPSVLVIETQLAALDLYLYLRMLMNYLTALMMMARVMMTYRVTFEDYLGANGLAIDEDTMHGMIRDRLRGRDAGMPMRPLSVASGHTVGLR